MTLVQQIREEIETLRRDLSQHRVVDFRLGATYALDELKQRLVALQAVIEARENDMKTLSFEELDRLSIRVGCETELNRQADLELRRRGCAFNAPHARWELMTTPPASPDEAREPEPDTWALAERIATRLFTSGGAPTVGSYPRAQRLVLTVDTPEHRTLGGWAFEPATREIARELKASASHEAREPESWRHAALLKDRTRAAIRERAVAGESSEALATDYGVPMGFIEHLKVWQMDGEAREP